MKLKLKTSKSARKRFRVSGKGKMMHRHARMNHFNARESGNTRRLNRPQEELANQNKKDIKNLMPYI